MLPGITIAEVGQYSLNQNGVWFVPAQFDFDAGESLARVEFFDPATLDDARFRQVEQCCVVETDPPTFYSLWLRARVTAAFRVRPLIAGDSSRTTILDIGFFAVIFGEGGEPAFHPFVCVEVCGDGPELEFLASVSNPDERKRIACAFRSLALARSLDLAPFSDYCNLDFDYDAWFVKLGLDNRGTFFALDVAGYDEEDVGGWNDGHAGLPGHESRECDECGGEGEESFFPVGELCEVCRGGGRLSWVERCAGRKRRPKSAFRE